LNPKKLLDVGFSHRPQHTPLARYLKLHKIPTESKINDLRPMEDKDVSAVHNILNNYLEKFPFHMKFTVDEVRHFLLPRKDVIYTYVVEDQNKQVTDLISFYYLPSSILKHVEHKTLRVAYSYYNVPG
jgi:glycylpeptide N-tetradecanoyltransferase